MLRKVTVIICLAALGSCQAQHHDQGANPRFGDWGVEIEHISPSTKPGDDFFTYVNEGWLESNRIPDGLSAYSVFDRLYLENQARIKDIITSASAEQNQHDAERKVHAFYRSYLDTQLLDQLGISPASQGLAEIASAKTHDDIARLFAAIGQKSLFKPDVSRDEKDPGKLRIYIHQDGLGLPDREYYLAEDERFAEIREAYVRYIEDVLSVIGFQNAAVRARKILELEVDIASRHWDRVQASDRIARYNPMTRAGVIAHAPEFPWARYLNAFGLGRNEHYVVAEYTAIRQLAILFSDTPVEVWKDYLSFHHLFGNRNYLSEDFFQHSFAFYDRTVRGAEQPRPREDRAVSLTDSLLPELVGKLYAERYFPSRHKAQVEELAEYARNALGQRIRKLDWMDKETRGEALRKLEGFKAKLGYPDRWRNYAGLEIKSDDLFGNVARIKAWERADEISRSLEPLRKWRWQMMPQEINAYYSASDNEIVIPAGIIQAPFFDPHADPAVNFAGMGAIIGHEMGHGFDPQGSRSDADGVLRNWWSDAAREAFEIRAQKLVDQYSAYTPLAGMYVNGELTLDENIGDLGGLAIAYHAYRLYLDDHPEDDRIIDGFSPGQRFFLASAQGQRYLYTEGFLKWLITSDGHSPAHFRVNGVVRNMDAWYDAFGVTREDNLYLPPEERVTIW